MKINNRIAKLGEYHFKKIDDEKKEFLRSGKKIIDLGIGDPDLPVHPDILKELVDSLSVKDFNKYPPYDGLEELKKQIIKYYKNTYSVKLDLDEVLVLIGSKEGISNIIPAVCNFGDGIIMTDPSYPVYETAANLWGAVPYKIPLKEKNKFLPELNHISDRDMLKSKIFIINYPNNPTGAVANEEFYKDIVKFCADRDIVLCNDSAYNEIIEENRDPISILQYDRDKKNCIEFGTMSKTYNMTGFRIGYAVGNRGVIKALLTIKSNLDSGQFKPIQYAAIKALNLDRGYINSIRHIYDERRKSAEVILKNKNIEFFKTTGTFYIWCKVPKNYTTYEFCSEVLRKHGIVVTPGYSFGNLGYEYFRIALTKDKFIIEEGLNKFDIYNL
ncbi:LL-diaminopimelate aminotransferase [Clostridium pasteurianum DSM 525 = ATCC 6013]|uniref:LL-diaminopimelate aminotransferase n=1 Tax=Clostridium pasteurianum DSM 525 = ATCC 6013 TaxID=1262449 RepID=A0A0H3J535_CLOPA|nr:aminotransferase class I/II-fold pyridoxal phosphate-dependent enzyme [Clostridium pasteurianum]AJA48182.1 LL-diaminopimelate aminotransferase [Clostridium pasteurianum DSM 525 = ATCC 6013]AJA52170.1 LL-diaminopimelate aminotransferase [Clostridium pasteurianum DSM 525 = ATCC 6013]AOZ75441.1 aspartate aminotransferase [Clostridium pasteurianum DSM 525 = ATCC 6013]AOZ79236.1 aspartate aminotransferase [Clostridium pasteurianum]ELP60666.1 PLP-dependent aminotransferase [Clostridium pasteurian